MNDRTKLHVKTNQSDNYKKYLFLVPILEQREVSHAELGRILEEHGFNRASVECIVANLTSHVLIYHPSPGTYRILTREQLAESEERALRIRRLKKELKKDGYKI